MTEAQWLESADPRQLFNLVESGGIKRKCLLFAGQCGTLKTRLKEMSQRWCVTWSATPFAASLKALLA